jgi:hypothetical protein
MEMLPVGEEIDLLDENDVYCPAVIIKKSPFQINYIGWGNTWNEYLTDKDFHRISYPAGKYVKKYKGWVRYTKELCHWPSLIYIRQPKEGSKLGSNYLKEENKVYVKPFGRNLQEMKHLRHIAEHGTWINTIHVWPYSVNLAKRWKENGDDPKFRNTFRDAVEECEASDTLNLSFKFNGSFDVAQMKRNMKAYSSSSSARSSSSGGGGASDSAGSSSANQQSEKLNEVRRKVFQTLAPELVPVLQNPLPVAAVITRINEAMTERVSLTNRGPGAGEQFRIRDQFQNLELIERWKEEFLRGYEAQKLKEGREGDGEGEEQGPGEGQRKNKRKGFVPQKIEMKRKKS